MKCLLVLCLLGLVALSMAGNKVHSRGCRHIMGTCVEDCPIGTHAYGTACSRKMPEATCDEPNPVLEEGLLCDFSACYCDAGTVRDTKADKCVKLDQCTKEQKKE